MAGRRVIAGNEEGRAFLDRMSVSAPDREKIAQASGGSVGA